MLDYNPDQRITVKEALYHPFLSQYHDENDEPTRNKISEFEFEYEKYDLTKE